MKVEVVFLSGSLQLSGSTTWLNTLIKGFEQQGISCIHLVTGVPTSIKSKAAQVFYTGRPRQQWQLRLMRWFQLHKLYRNFYGQQEVLFYSRRARQLLSSRLAEKVLVIKDFSTYLPEYFLDKRFRITAVLHQQYTELVKGYDYHNLCAVSETVKYESNRLGFDVEQVIYNPINIAEIQNLAEEYKPDEEGYLLFVGKLHKEKGVLELLKSYHQLVKENSINLKLIYVGEGKDGQCLKSYIDEHRLSNKVKLKGFLNNPYPYIKYSKLLILPSYSEAMGYVAVEAAVLETPYLVSNFTAASEFFCADNIFKSQGKQLDTDNMKNKILCLLKNPQFSLNTDIVNKMQLSYIVPQFYNQINNQE